MAFNEDTKVFEVASNRATHNGVNLISSTNLTDWGNIGVVPYFNGVVVNEPILLVKGNEVEFTPPTGKLFTSLYSISDYGEYAVGTVQEEGRKAVLKIPTNDKYTNVNFSFKDAPKEWDGRYFFTRQDLEKLATLEIKPYLDGALVVEPIEVLKGQLLMLEAPEGYEFYSLWVTDEAGEYVTWDYNDDRTQASIIVGSFKPQGVTNVELREIYDKKVMGGFNNIYKVDDEIMKAFTKESLNIMIVGGDDRQIRDYSSFIINCLLLPFNIGNSHVVANEKIRLGEKVVEVNSPVMDTDVLKVDLGTVAVPKGGSSLDYQTTKILVKLPFVDSVILDVEKVIGFDITVSYEINLYSGETVINIKSSGYENYIYSSIVVIGTGIPTANYARPPSLVSNPSIGIGVNNERYNFSIEVLKNVEALPDNIFNIPIKDFGTLENEKGFVQVDNINLIGGCFGKDRDDVINMLNSGVIIK